MRSMKPIVAAAAALLGPAQAGAQARDSFCPELKRVIEEVRYEGAFDGLERSRAAPPRLGFVRGCRAYPATETLPPAWWCHQNLAPEHLSLASLAAGTARCLPDAVRTTGGYGREVSFILPYARIRIEEHGGPGAHVGRIVNYRVEAIRPPK